MEARLGSFLIKARKCVERLLKQELEIVRLNCGYVVGNWAHGLRLTI